MRGPGNTEGRFRSHLLQAPPTCPMRLTSVQAWLPPLPPVVQCPLATDPGPGFPQALLPMQPSWDTRPLPALLGSRDPWGSPAVLSSSAPPCLPVPTPTQCPHSQPHSHTLQGAWDILALQPALVHTSCPQLSSASVIAGPAAAEPNWGSRVVSLPLWPLRLSH